VNPDSEIIELQHDRPDPRRDHETVGHYTRESFMRATGGRPQLACLFCRGYADAIDHLKGCPNREFKSAGDVLAEMRHIWKTPLATDREIRAACNFRRERKEGIQ
jgi:hypothetical protein